MASLQRSLYLAARTVGDVKAIQRGRMPRRYGRRLYHRRLIGLLRRSRIW